MRIEPKSAGAYSAGAFLFLLVFGLGWPGPGTWLLVFALAFLAAAAAVWWLDDALVASTAGGAVPVRQAAGPFAVNARGSDAPRRRPERGGRSVLLTLGLPGHDSNGRWVLPDRVHVTVVAGLVGVLAMIIFIGGALGGGGSSAGPAAPASQPSTALDFAQPVTPVLSPQLPTAEQTITPVPATVTPSPIVVETPESSRPLPAQPLDQPTTSTEPAQVVIHDVVAGDTIYDLAIAFETSIDAIMNANGISEFDTIRVGDRLIIPAGGA